MFSTHAGSGERELASFLSFLFSLDACFRLEAQHSPCNTEHLVPLFLHCISWRFWEPHECALLHLYRRTNWELMYLVASLPGGRKPIPTLSYSIILSI